MSDKEWYEGKSLEDLEGCHVFVVYDNGTRVFGCLDRYGCIDPGENANKMFNRVFSTEHQTVAKGVKSVTLLWDERYWTQIPLADTREGDRLVIGSSVVEICYAESDKQHHMMWNIDGGEEASITSDMVTCALRKRRDVPDKPGIYLGSDKSLIARLLAPGGGKWFRMSNDFTSICGYLEDKDIEQYNPLKPLKLVEEDKNE